MMPRDGQTHFKNLAAFAARFLSMSGRFETLCMKWLSGFLSRIFLNSFYAAGLFRYTLKTLENLERDH